MAAVLESLSRKCTSGVLEVDGNPTGAIYLDQGQITFARASWVPDLTARLCGVLRPTPELRNFLRGSDQADRDIGTTLVEHGFVTLTELQSVLRSAIVDALIVLTMPMAGGSSVSDIRFEAPGAHWAAAFVQLPLASVQSEVSRRARQMARAGVVHTVAVALTDLDRGPAFLTRDQWAIAGRVNGALTPRDLARQSGLPLYDTITALGGLLRRGLCTLATPAAVAIPPAVATLGGRQIWPAPVGSVGPVPSGTAPGPADVPAGAPAHPGDTDPRYTSFPRRADALPDPPEYGPPDAPDVRATPVRRRPSSGPVAEPDPLTSSDGTVTPDAVPSPAPIPAGSEAGFSLPADATGPGQGHEPRRPRGAHRAEPAVMLPYPRRPVLPQRDPEARLVRPRDATEPLPVATRVWPGPEPVGGSESEAYASSGPDLLRRVLEGLRRLS